jgi:hypothetical protein
MTTAVSTNLQSEWIKYAFTTESMSARPTSWKIGLHTGDPTQNGSANEVTTGLDAAYVRQTATWTRTLGQVANAALINFPVTAATYTVTYITVWDNTGTVCLYVGALSLAKLLAVGDTFSFPVGQLTLSVQ